MIIIVMNSLRAGPAARLLRDTSAFQSPTPVARARVNHPLAAHGLTTLFSVWHLEGQEANES